MATPGVATPSIHKIFYTAVENFRAKSIKKLLIVDAPYGVFEWFEIERLVKEFVKTNGADENAAKLMRKIQKLRKRAQKKVAEEANASEKIAEKQDTPKETAEKPDASENVAPRSDAPKKPNALEKVAEEHHAPEKTAEKRAPKKPDSPPSFSLALSNYSIPKRRRASDNLSEDDQKTSQNETTLPKTHETPDDAAKQLKKNRKSRKRSQKKTAEKPNAPNKTTQKPDSPIAFSSAMSNYSIPKKQRASDDLPEVVDDQKTSQSELILLKTPEFNENQPPVALSPNDLPEDVDDEKTFLNGVPIDPELLKRMDAELAKANELAGEPPSKKRHWCPQCIDILH